MLKYFCALGILFSIPAHADFSVMFTDCKNIIADGTTLEVTPGSPYSMSCIETKNTYRCNVQYGNNTTKESVFVRNVDPSGRLYFGATDGSVSYQVNLKDRRAMSSVRISTKTMLGTRTCNGTFMTDKEAKQYIQKVKSGEKPTVPTPQTPPTAPAIQSPPAPVPTPSPAAPPAPGTAS